MICFAKLFAHPLSFFIYRNFLWSDVFVKCRSQKIYVYSMMVPSVFAIVSIFDFFKLRFELVEVIFGFFPLYENGLGSASPSLMVAILAYLLDYRKGNVKKEASSSITYK